MEVLKTTGHAKMNNEEVEVQTALGLTTCFQIRVYYLTKKLGRKRIIATGVSWHVTAIEALNRWWENFNLSSKKLKIFKRAHNREVVATVQDDNIIGNSSDFLHCGGTRNIKLYHKGKITPWSECILIPHFNKKGICVGIRPYIPVGDYFGK